MAPTYTTVFFNVFWVTVFFFSLSSFTYLKHSVFYQQLLLNDPSTSGNIKNSRNVQLKKQSISQVLNESLGRNEDIYAVAKVKFLMSG